MYFVFLFRSRDLEEDFTIVLRSVLVTVIVNPLLRFMKGTTNQKGVASLAVLPTSTPSPQSKTTLLLSEP